MLNIVLFLSLCAIGSVTSYHASFECVEKCHDLPFQKRLREIDEIPPTIEEIKELCPLAIEMLDCTFDKVKECNGHSVVELASSTNQTVAESAQGLLLVAELVGEICDENSQLHADVVESRDCFVSITNNDRLQDCGKEGYDEARAFAESSSIFEDKDDDDLMSQVSCLRAGYTVACMSSVVQKECGDAASRVLFALITKLGIAYDNPCKDQGREILRGDFAASLKQEGEEKEHYLSVFEIFKRR